MKEFIVYKDKTYYMGFLMWTTEYKKALKMEEWKAIFIASVYGGLVIK